MTQIYRSSMEFTNFDEIPDRPHTKRACDERAASVRATARRRERNFKLKVSPRVGETSVRRACGQRRADENDILHENDHRALARVACDPMWATARRRERNFMLKKQPRADDKRSPFSCGQRRADENKILCKKTNRAQTTGDG